MTPPSFHAPPRHPHRWWLWLLLSQLAVVCLWWRFGWALGLLLMVASHLPFWWGVLHPGARFYSPVLRSLPVRDRRVWLTIDDGPSAETPAILDLLDRHGARATFFVVGDRVAARPAVTREILARGHALGNHSHSHPQAWFWALGPKRMRAQIERAQSQIEAATGVRPHWFRAVVGMANPFVAAPLRDLGLARVGWTARGYDGVNANTADVVRRIERDLAPGAIILMHEGAAHGKNVAQLALLLERLQALGYETVLPEHLPSPLVEKVARSAG